MPDRKTDLRTTTVGRQMPFLTAIKPPRGAATIALSVSASGACRAKRMTTQLQLPRGERGLQRAHDRFLAHEIGERTRAPAAVQGERHGSPFREIFEAAPVSSHPAGGIIGV